MVISMKKIFKAVISISLSVIMLFSCTSVAFAKNTTTPVILVHGLGANPVYENVGTKEQSEIANLGLGDIASGIMGNVDLMCQVLRMLDKGRKNDDNTLINSLADFTSGASVLNCTKNGNVKKGQGIDNYWTDSLANHKDYWQNATTAEASIARQLCNTIGASNVYCYNYDWRQDICQTADGLNTYIKTIKKKTGAKKVSLVGCSLGGSVLSAYIDAYKGNKDIERCIFVNAAFMGVDVASAYALDLSIDKTAVLNFVKCMETEYDCGSQKALFRILRATLDVRISNACDYLDEFASSKKNVKKLYNNVLKDWIGYIPSLWECIPYNTFDKAVKEMSAIGFLDKHSGLYKKIKKYHGVQGRLASNLKAIKKQGVQVAIIAGYSSMGIPITSKAYNQTDVLIDTKYASAGATVAKYGKTLSASGKYVSGDKIINAKTCYLPDNTWFIKGLQHMRFNYGSDSTKLVAALACGKVKCNIASVKSKYGYTQFSQLSSNGKLSKV